VICSGRQPNVEIAESAGLPISKEDGGLVVEATLEVAPDIYAAGDIISWHVTLLYHFLD
jgi:pyruvate/2-oxoglutarate dehydrogenase complex dihydrolipoamide dehydrogenase (E3) component